MAATLEMSPVSPVEDALAIPEVPEPEPVEPQTAADIIEAGELERIQLQGPGASGNYTLSDNMELRILRREAEELGLAIRKGPSSSVTLYHPGDELLFGVVPFSFEELGLHEDLVLALLSWDPPIEKATQIQAAAIPKILQGEDVAIQAESGGGKTFAYLLPTANYAVEKAWGKQRKSAYQAAKAAAEASPAPESAAAEQSEAEKNPEEVTSAVCYRVEPTAGKEGLRLLKRPEEYSPNADGKLRVSDEFMAKNTIGSPMGTQFVELADGRGWVKWPRDSLRYRYVLSAREYRLGQRVRVTQPLTYGSGDVVEKSSQGTIMRLLPYVGVQWDGLAGIKAVQSPREVLREATTPKDTSKWAAYAPDTLIITTSRELCDQVADVARKLGSLLPDHVQDNWKVAVAVGAPPGVGKRLKRGKEQWPFPKGEGAPNVLVTTLEFIAYYFHRKHVPMWGSIRYVVFDEVDQLISGKEQKLLNRVKVMFLRARRTIGVKAQTILVTSTMPSQGGKSTRLLIQRWMPHALRALPRPDLLHRNHPMLEQYWHKTTTQIEDKVERLVDFLFNAVGTLPGAKNRCVMKEKTLIFCNSGQTAIQLAETLATGYRIAQVGLFVSEIGNDERRKRLQMFREGKITLMVTTELLTRGIDIPDLKNVVSFQFPKNVVLYLHRIGRATRGTTLGRVLNLYDDSEQGGRLLAEAIQEIGSGPLDGLFSRRRGLRRIMKRTEAFREMLLMQGLPLPPHLQIGRPQAPPMALSKLLESVDEDEEYDEEETETQALDEERGADPLDLTDAV